MSLGARIVAGEEGVAVCADLLRRGGIAGVPTETVYGLAADAFQPMAVASIFEAKGRPLSDPLIVHLPDVAWIERVAFLESDIERGLVGLLAEAFWPGPLTLLLKRHPDIPELVTAGSDRIAIRVTAHPLFQELLRQVGSPLAAPSANRFGRISPVTAQDVRSELGGVISLILEGGASRHGLESTILSLTSLGMEILRPGPITEDQLKKYGHIVHRESLVKTPGSLPGHYAPRKSLSILNSDIMGLPNSKKCGLLAFRQPSSDVVDRFQVVKVLSPSGDLREAAANFYSHLRALDESAVESIYSEPLPEEGIGVAIMDRLRRAEYGSKHGTGHSNSENTLG
jgi:L-threonylcarbamoyladenylate synthase